MIVSRFALLCLLWSLLALGQTRAQTPGSLDTTFNANLTGGTSPSPSPSALAIAPAPDGKIYIGGDFTAVGGTTRLRIARLNAGGTLDASFDPGTGADATVRSVTVLEDGKLLIAGIFTTVNGTSRPRIARLNNNGSLDSTFDPGLGANDYIYAVAVQPDGKIIVAGAFTSFNGVARKYIARLHSDGRVDTTFDPGTGTNALIITALLQPDGKILISGAFTTHNGTSAPYVLRLNGNGTRDTTFAVGTGANTSAGCFVLRPDGKILMAGRFTTYRGTTRNRIALLNSDGTLDPSFDPGAGPNSFPSALALQADGKILVAGEFLEVAGIERRGIARLHGDGTLDTSFNPGTGSGGPAYGLALQADGKVVIGGFFSTYNGTARVGLARLSNGLAGQSLAVPDATQVRWHRGGTAPEVSDAKFDLSTDAGASWTPLGEGARVNLGPGWQVTGRSLPATGLVRARGWLAAGMNNGGRTYIEQVAAYDLNAQTLLAPTSDAITASPINVAFSLPAAARSGTLQLAFEGYVLTLAASQLTAGEHSFTFNPAAPTAGAAIASGSRIPDGTYMVTLSYTTAAGVPPTTDTAARVTLDTTPPTIANHENVTAAATGLDGAIVSYAPAAVTDAGTASPTVTYSKESGTLFPVGDTVVTITARDAVNNTATKTFKVTVRDATPPEIAPYADVTAEATSAQGAIVTFEPATASDLFTASPTISYSQNSGTRFPLGTTGVTITARDAENNVATRSFNVIVRDSIPPEIAPHDPVTMEADGPTGAVVVYAPATAVDAVTASPTFEYSHPSGSRFPRGNTAVTVTARDAAGNTATASFQVRVQDTTAPVVAAHADVSVGGGGPDGALVTYAPGAASDAVTASPVLTYSHPSGTQFPLGSTTVTMTATDEAGNAGLGTFVVTVLDNTAPVISVPEDIVVTATGAAGAVVSFSVSAEDAVDGATSATPDPLSGSVFPIGSTLVTVTSTDQARNRGMATFTVTVQPSSDARLASLSVEGAVLVPAFNPAITTGYTATVGNATTAAAISAMPAFSVATVAYLPATNPVPLQQGGNPVQVVVTAQDGTTTRTYAVTIRRTVADAIKPIVKITAPNAKPIASPLTIGGTFTETVGLASLTATLNGGASMAVPLSADAGTAVPWTLPGLAPENGPNVLTVTATDYNGNVGIATKTFIYQNAAFAALAGVYQAQFEPAATPGFGSIGWIGVTVTKAGTFTGKARLPGLTKSLTGVLRNDGSAAFKLKSALVPTVELGAAGQLRFGITSADGLVGQTASATFAGRIAPYHAENKVPGPPAAAFLNLPADQPSRGLYTAGLFQRSPLAGTPPGFGYASIKLSNTGSLKVSGSLPDGTKLSAGTKLRADGTAPVFAELYGKKGGFGVALDLSANPASTSSRRSPQRGAGSVTGPDVVGRNLVWLRPGKAADPLFPDGWETGLALEMAGAHWPAPDRAPLDLGQGSSTPATGNATLEFSAGGLDGPLRKPVDLNPATGRVTLVLPAGETSRGYTLKASAATGLFSGSVTIGGKTQRFRGTFLRVPDGPAGAGYFLNPPAAEAGAVLFEP